MDEKVTCVYIEHFALTIIKFCESLVDFRLTSLRICMGMLLLVYFNSVELIFALNST